MGLWKGTKKAIGHVVDTRVDQWIDLHSLQNSTCYFWNHLKSLFNIKKPKYTESFEEAVDRMALSPETLTKQSLYFRKLSLLFLVMTIALIIYAAALYRFNNWTGSIICFSLSLYAVSLAFRFHFWHLQISQKKLGLNIREYYRCVLAAKGKNQP